MAAGGRLFLRASGRGETGIRGFLLQNSPGIIIILVTKTTEIPRRDQMKNFAIFMLCVAAATSASAFPRVVLGELVTSTS
jgi:hypothetical protein